MSMAESPEIYAILDFSFSSSEQVVKPHDTASLVEYEVHRQH